MIALAVFIFMTIGYLGLVIIDDIWGEEEAR